MGRDLPHSPGVTPDRLQQLLHSFREGEVSESQLLQQLAESSFEDLGFAKVDTGRQARQGVPEVVLGQGKTGEQVVAIALKLRQRDQPVLVTRASEEMARSFKEAFPSGNHHPLARCLTLGSPEAPRFEGRVVVATGGTGDLAVAEEAAVCCEFMGSPVERLYDVGVAGLSRLLSRLDILRRAQVAIVVAGMEGALPSVVAGLIPIPVIAVPTSIGYGASFGGLAALLGMLTSCASGVTVANIDNGFGAAFAARRIQEQIHTR